jgi:Rrf2 family iron-sulfur cluster assembly transcriptional regulator
MRLTTKGRFAVTAMIDLGLRQEKGPVTLAAISQRQRISLSYLEQLFGRLRRHELVESSATEASTLGTTPCSLAPWDAPPP